MKIIGLTGGIGSGKTAVLDILSSEYGAYIIEADKLAHKLMEPGQSVYKAVVDYFGTDILNEDNYIDRKKLGAIVFNDEAKLQKLNSLSHPLVKEAILSQIDEQRKLRTELFVIEAALLIQDGYTDICHIMCYVYADLSIRIERLCTYRGFNKERAESVIASQDSEEFYREHCDYIIDNSGSLEATRQQVEDICRIILTIK